MSWVWGPASNEQYILHHMMSVASDYKKLFDFEQAENSLIKLIILKKKNEMSTLCDDF